MNQKVLYKVFIWGFLALYLCVALISFCHAIQFFDIGNVRWMSITLAGAFELGLALSLASILLSDKNKSAWLPWALTILLTSVQVVGNVYSVYKFISESGTEYYQYLANSLLFWIEDVSPETVKVIISWIMGAILPVIALCMTDMVASNIKNSSSSNDDIKEDSHSVMEEEDVVPHEVEHQDEQIIEEPKEEVQNDEREVDEPKQERDLFNVDDITTKIKNVFQKSKKRQISEDARKSTDDHYFDDYHPVDNK